MNLGVGIGLGTALGVLGSQIIDAPWPIGVGIALGVAFGQMAQSKKKKNDNPIDEE